MTQQQGEGRFTRRVELEAWLYDSQSANVNARATLRYHREGWCSATEPYGVRVAPVITIEGNPNDFHCHHCDYTFRRVVVEKERAKQLKAMPVEVFEGTNALRGVDSLPVSRFVAGCDCATGYEHVQRAPHPETVEGSTPAGCEVVPVVFGRFVVEMAARDVPQTPLVGGVAPRHERERHFVDPDFDNPWCGRR